MGIKMKIICNSWISAYRSKDEKKFHIIPNPICGYAADPFVVEENGKTYIFAEIFDYCKSKAAIGYYELADRKWKIIIEENYHLSYPYIYKEGNDWYIIPESSSNSDISRYKAVRFPEQWEKDCILIEGIKCSDTTLAWENGNTYGMTCFYHEDPIQMYLFRIINNKIEFSEKNPVVCGKELSRPGGACIRKNGRLYRTIQDCSVDYGRELIFSEIQINWPDFHEKVAKRIRVDDIKTKQPIVKAGIHTYNQSESYEVVDFRIKTFNIVARMYKLIHLLNEFFIQ